jgi:hypothetical protein
MQQSYFALSSCEPVAGGYVVCKMEHEDEDVLLPPAYIQTHE